MWKVLLPVFLILACAVGGLYLVRGYTQKTRVEAGPSDIRVGSTLPNFTLKQYGNGNVEASSLKGKVVLLNFWATWCEACMVEMPSIVKLRNLYKDKGFEVIAVNVDENPEAVLPRTLKRLGIDFPVYTDAAGSLAEIFDVHAIPLTVIMDHDRKILMIENGERDWNGNDIHSEIDRWLAG